MARVKNKAATKTAANVRYESWLWQAADALRGSIDAVENKNVNETAPPSTAQSTWRICLV